MRRALFRLLKLSPVGLPRGQINHGCAKLFNHSYNSGTIGFNEWKNAF